MVLANEVKMIVLCYASDQPESGILSFILFVKKIKNLIRVKPFECVHQSSLAVLIGVDLVHVGFMKFMSVRHYLHYVHCPLSLLCTSESTKVFFFERQCFGGP